MEDNDKMIGYDDEKEKVAEDEAHQGRQNIAVNMIVFLSPATERYYVLLIFTSFRMSYAKGWIASCKVE